MNRPPRLAEIILSFISRSDGRTSILGDFSEIYDEHVQQKGKLPASCWYWSQIIKSLPMFLASQIQWRLNMIRNYIVIAFRNILKHKIFSLINITGMAVGLALCLLVIKIVGAMYSSDRFHENRNRIYRVTSFAVEKNHEQYELATAAFPAASIIKEYPEIEEVTRLKKNFSGAATYENKTLIVQGYYMDENFDDVFSFDMIAGNPSTALVEPYSLVLTSKLAVKFFGQKNPIGEIILFPELGEFKVTGILRDYPDRLSHMQFELLASMSTVQSLETEKKIRPCLTNWRNFSGNYIYILLRKDFSPADVEIRLKDIIEKHYSKTDVPIKAFRLQALTDISPGHSLANSLTPATPPEAAYVFSVFAFIILITACFNYTHLSISKALCRAKEAGIRKVIGANRSHLFTQFLCESILVSLISLGFALAFLPVFIKIFQILNAGIGLAVPLHNKGNLPTYLVFIGTAVFSGLLSGILPALYISRLQPIKVLKDITQLRLFSRLSLRKALVVTQFCISLILIIFLGVGYKQSRFLKNFDYKFNAQNILNVEIDKVDYQIFRQEIIGYSGVENISASGYILGTGVTFITFVEWEGSSEPLEINELQVDENFIENYRLNLIAGQNFSENPIKSRERFGIVNTTAVQRFGFKSPSDILGKQLTIEKKPIEIIGVVSDFTFQNSSQPVKPLLLRILPEYFNYANIRIHSQSQQNFISLLTDKWKELSPLYPINYQFHSEALEESLEGIKLSMRSIGFIAFLAVFIAFFGLLGMVIFDTETRTKEIGIRKVLGASLSELIGTLSKSFIRLLLLAALLASPLSWYGSNMYLREYHNRVSIGIEPFVIGCGSVFLLGFLVIFIQTWRTALTDPAQSLRNE